VILFDGLSPRQNAPEDYIFSIWISLLQLTQCRIHTYKNTLSLAWQP